ncbi:MAG: TIM barrel protein possibly involved in myo-inositol catabolism [uncultured Solirubrobacteraceae bacterium]|uniref:TIM barrel protein possibly involved in myo-inositol catabolism n=1 Tax=uncultured Solirubrobacteraceae bacterium TaxID=1162706 RepID=A0A6J4T698_9ACTN|nr:MAG: TIM barrel protein possibly involved in myo-inositol catabolism [uncultured Solirubrobacteraceae bacterium]
MRVGGDGLHLTYCTSIHPASGWPAVEESLRAHAPALKARLSPDAPFGLGLRLSGAESSELLEGDRLARFRAWLDDQGLYVFTLNGFPHGTFHGQPVKVDVHAPDWRSEERVRYTSRLAEILAVLLPDGQSGTISTSPLSYRPWIGDDADGLATATANVRRVAAALSELCAERGVHIALAIEPEADGLLADCQELIRWWPEDLDREHVTACFDVCHASVAYENPAETLRALADAGIAVGKVQLSAAIRVALGDAEHRRRVGERLGEFADPVYLHQVTCRDRDGTLVGFPDLPEGLHAVSEPTAEEVRVHFHVPIFLEGYGELGCTQGDLRETIALVRDGSVSSHLEIETYTWDVLPDELKASPVDSIAREYAWVLDALG